MSRSILVGPGNVAGLSIVQNVTDAVGSKAGLEEFKLTQTSLSTLIQAGADELIIGSLMPTGSISAAVEKRIRRIDENHFSGRTTILQAFDRMMPTGYFGEALNLKDLLGDLAIASKLGAATLGYPLPVKELEADIQPESFAPIRVFLTQLKSVETDVALPARIASKRDVETLLDLVSSDVYRDYSAAHQSLESDQNVNRALSIIREKTDRLLRRGRGQLMKSSAKIGLLKMAKTLVEEKLGKIPGEFGDVLLEVFQEAISRRQNLIIYSSSGNIMFPLLSYLVSATAHDVESIDPS